MKNRHRLTVLLLWLSASPAMAYVLFDAGGFMGYTYNKWGPPQPGTPATVYWSYMPAGTVGSVYCTDACPGISSSTLQVYNDASQQWEPRDLSEMQALIEHALATWAAAGNIVFIGPVDDDASLAINDPAAVPPVTGHIRIGAFAFSGDAQFLGAVGYAPPPNGGTGEGDILFNSTAFYHIAQGIEDVTPIDFGFGNDFESLFVHELGHALGLAHSDEPASVMYISPAGEYLINRELAADDIAGIQVLYAAPADADADGVLDFADNCLDVPNPGQRDTDSDAIGNFCDADFNNDCFVDFLDVGAFKADFLANGDLNTDLDGDAFVGFFDLAIVKSSFLAPPGPSGLPDSCN